MWVPEGLDKEIFSRIKEKLQSKYIVQCSKNHRLAAGVPRPQLADNFGDDCLSVFYIIPKEPSKEKYDQHYSNVLLHKSLDEKPGFKKPGFKKPGFVILLPREVLCDPPDLPYSLKVYEPLIEDDKFMERVDETINKIKSEANKNSTE